MPQGDSVVNALHLARRASLRDEGNESAKRQISQVKLPVELLEQIIKECLDNDRSFASVAGLSVASRLLRGIVKRLYFRTTRLYTVESAKKVLLIPEITRCIRHLSLSTFTLVLVLASHSPVPLRKMNLSSLEIDLKGTPISSLLIGALPSTLRLLRVVSMAQVSAKDLASIAINCRDLEGLEVSVTDKLDGSCCWQCFEESESCVVHSPIGHGKRARTFEEVIDAYAKALHPLTRLRRLALGVFVSPASVLTTHLDVHRADAQPFTTKGTPAYDIASAQNTPAVASSPRVKMSDYQLVQAPPATNIRDHVERFGRFATPTRCMDCVNEHSEIVRRDELRAAVRLAQRLKSLESVWWSSWFSGDDRQGSAGAMWTRLSVVREGTRMKVSRQRRV